MLIYLLFLHLSNRNEKEESSIILMLCNENPPVQLKSSRSQGGLALG